ncbi:MAG TPA: NADH-quinone oxidoreductase subunit L [Planctomycetota bacterium]|jgi:NADH-quinone oxidoreductase subunit L
MSHFLQWFVDLCYTALPLKERWLLERTLAVIPLLPLAGFLINGLFGARLPKKISGWIGVLACFGAFVWAFMCVMALGLPGHGGVGERNALHAIYGTWLNTPDLNVSFGLYLDGLSAVMILFVTGVGTLIHLYSLGYMAHDEGFWRFFAYLNLFMFAMILLVLGDNLVLLFVGWEGVGLCSYLLIGFWYQDGKNAAAGMKAFIVNRIGDLGFVLGMFMLLILFGTLSYVAAPVREGAGRITPRTQLTKAPAIAPADPNAPVLSRADYVKLPAKPGLLDYTDGLRLLISDRHDPKSDPKRVGYAAPAHVSNLDLSRTIAKQKWAGWYLIDAITVACLLLFIGAIGKSAQIPLYVWLPDAMAGPTPVSALIHAATMVTAGVYMVCRLHGLYSLSEDAMLAVAIVGGATALYSALIGLTQLDIKKVLAYSTVSQLGYMFLALGVGAFSLGIFHVLTHAFFKALLFLGAGSVIHALSGEQDLRRMGGLREKLPVTFWTMLIGVLALSGIPPFAGWWSKDPILETTLAHYFEHGAHRNIYVVLYALGVAGAFCTAFYSFRLFCLAFLGSSRASEETQKHVHESPLSMTFPLIVLAAFSVIGGMLWARPFILNPESVGILNAFHGESHRAEHINEIATLIVAFGGAAIAFCAYGLNGKVPDPASASRNFFYRLSLNKFYVDEIYQALIITPFVVGSNVALWLVDTVIIEGVVVLLIGRGTSKLGDVLRRMQTGLLNWYAGGILAGALLLLFYLLQG